MASGQKTSGQHVIVIGGGLGGLSAAIHLRLAGVEVTVLEANEQVGGRASQIQVEGFTFDTGPTLLNYPWVFQRLFEKAGRSLPAAVKLMPVDPSIMFLWPDGQHFHLSSNLCQLVSEVERVEPGGTPGLMAFLADANAKYRIAFDKLVCHNARNWVDWFSRLSPPDLWRTAIWRSLDRELGRFFRSPLIRDALGSYGMYLGGSPYQLPGLFSILAYGELSQGLWLPRWGIYALVQAIERLAEELGVRILTRHRVQKIILAGAAVKGVELEDGKVLESPLIISNVDVPTTQRVLLGRDGADNRDVRMTPSAMTFYWGVRGKVEGAGHHSIFLPHDARRNYDDLFKRERVPGQLPFYMSIATETEPSLAPADCSTVFILVPLPRISRLKEWDMVDLASHLKARIFERLKQQGIALKPEDLIVQRVFSPRDWETRFGLYDGSAFGASHTLFQMGPFRSPNRDPSISGLYYVGASTTPGTGLPMVVLGGEMTAERVLNDLY